MAKRGQASSGTQRGARKREPTYKCCVDTFPPPTTGVPARSVTRPSQGMRLASMPFSIQATFKNDTLPSPQPLPCQCPCCEYKQSVKGFFSYRGEKLTHMLAGGQVMSETAWQEDGARVNGVDIHYGHRNETERALRDRYTPRRADGCTYEGADRPGLQGGAGEAFEINLQFKGEIIDVCSGAIVQTRTWSFRMKGTLSRRSRFWT